MNENLAFTIHIRDAPVDSQEGAGDSTLIRRVCATGVLNLPPVSRVGKPKNDTLFWTSLGGGGHFHINQYGMCRFSGYHFSA